MALRDPLDSNCEPSVMVRLHLLFSWAAPLIRGVKRHRDKHGDTGRVLNIQRRVETAIAVGEYGRVARGLNKEQTARGWCVMEALLTLSTVFTSLAGEGDVPHPHFRCGRV